MKEDARDSLPQSARDLFERNKAFIQSVNVGFAGLLDSIEHLESQLIFDGDDCINLQVKDKSLYGDTIQTYLANQLQQLQTNPDRIVFPDVKHCNPTAVTRAFMEKLNRAYFDEKETLDVAKAPVVDSGFFFLFGMGSGQIIETVLDHIKIRHLFIIEPIQEFFIQSFFVMDWEKIYQKARDNGIQLHFFFNKDPYESVEEIEKNIRDVGNTFIEGSYYFVHYTSWELKEINKLLKERIRVYFVTTGFFEDEHLMMRNTYMNLMGPDFRLLKRQKMLNQDYPVFVAASGPSLEFDLPYLKKIRDQVILFSSGTTLNILMNNGIKPDYQVELENTPAVYKIMHGKAQDYDLSGITLIASTSADPRLRTLFDKAIFFPRGAVSSTSVFFNNEGAINEVAPMSANTALASAATMGFRNIYLVGVDCGRLVGMDHHAPGSIYEELGVTKSIEEHSEFTRIVPGNFGGQATTTFFLDMSRRSITSLINRLNLKVHNCSNGSRIDQTIPLAIGGVKLTSNPAQREVVKARVESQLPLCAKGNIIDFDVFDRALASVPLMKQYLAECFQDQHENATSFYELDKAIERLWKDKWQECGLLMIIMGGSMASMIRLGAYFGNRLIDEEERNTLRHATYDVFHEQMLWMTDVVEDFYQQFKERKQEIELPKRHALDYLKPRRMRFLYPGFEDDPDYNEEDYDLYDMDEEQSDA